METVQELVIKSKKPTTKIDSTKISD